MKRLLIALGVFIMLVSGVLIWRATHPPLTDSQQIAANIEGMVAAARARTASGIGSYLSPEFRYGGMKKSDFQRTLVGGILQYRVIDVHTSNVNVTVQGESATSTGNYKLSLKSEYDSPPELYAGRFTLKWRKEDGRWNVVGAEGMQIPQMGQ